MILMSFCSKFIGVCTNNHFTVKRFDKVTAEIVVQFFCPTLYCSMDSCNLHTTRHAKKCIEVKLGV